MLRGSDYVGHPNESLARESVYSQSVTGCKSRLRTRIYTASHKTNTTVVRSVVVSCWSYTYAQFVSSGLLSWEFSAVHFSPLISDS